jgi:hypothetical protein
VPGAPDAEIDPAGVEGFERAELLGDDERRVVRQHHPAGADADGLRASGDMPDEDGGRRASDARYVVMLGEPEAVVAPRFGVPG